MQVELSSWECRPTGGDWVPAPVPGTAAAVFDVDDVDAVDWEWRSRLDAEPGAWTLALDGIATLCEVRLNGELVLESESMFQPHRVPVTLTGDDELLITCRALKPIVSKKHPRARWRTRVVEHQHLRWYRTTFLGRMPGWSPGPAPAGPWRPVRLVRGIEPRIAVRGTTVEVHADGSEVEIDGVRVPLADGRAVIDVPDAELWWPHTHGDPVLHDVLVDGARVARAGFRTVTFEHGQLAVNGVPVFCRGACWVPPDVVTLNGDPRPILERARAAGLNMVRVMGTMVWEDAPFWDACDDLGILVWQDCMFANVDPPDDEAWLSTVERELTAQLGALTGRASLAVVCGGSEVEQQAAMVGLAPDARAMPLFETRIPELLEALRLDVPYVRNSPTGGELPFRTHMGVAHYFGVGAYLRPFDDARRAGVRFTSECLAFSTPPERDASPRLGVPRDGGASWDFEDVRDHYVAELFGVDPALVRYEDRDRYLDLGRAAVVECFEAALSEWRRPGSGCGGALVLLLKDLHPGNGWGVLDVDGRPKAPWWAMRRLSQPFTLLSTDEGLNGLAIHAVNDTASPVVSTLRVDVFDVQGRRVESGETPVEVPARHGITVDAESVLGGFRDLTFAYRFGARTYDAVRVTFGDTEHVRLLADVVRPRQSSIGLAAAVGRDGRGWYVDVSTEQLAQRVAVDAGDLEPDDSWFHLAPGTTRRIRLQGESDRAPVGEVRALNSMAVGRFVAG